MHGRDRVLTARWTVECRTGSVRSGFYYVSLDDQAPPGYDWEALI